MILLLVGRWRSLCWGNPGLLSSTQPSLAVPLSHLVLIAAPGCLQGLGDVGHWEPPSPVQVVQEVKYVTPGHILGFQTPTGKKM